MALSPESPASTLRFDLQRSVTLLFLYALALALCRYFAYELRFDFEVPIEPTDYRAERWSSLAINIPFKLGFLLLFGQFRTLLTYFSLPDLMRIVGAVLSANLTTFVLRQFVAAESMTPRGVVLTDTVLAVCALGALRLGLRVYRERTTQQRNLVAGVQQKIVIAGAGDAGATLAKEFLNSPSRGFLPVAFVDDDRTKHGRTVHGVPVIGPAESIDQLKGRADLAKVVIAMPSASGKRIREIVQLMTHRGIKVETLPSMEELASGRVRASRIRPVEVQDLLGREAVNLDTAGIRQLVASRVVMVTGAGGSIGSELCRQISALTPQRLLMVEQSEPSLFLIEQELNELGLGATAVPLVADILDGPRMDYIFDRYRPEVIFHAAAHKHVYLMERQPSEAIRNNVFGTCQLARRAADRGVAAFVFISTDKAINPTSVMGATKRLAEIQMMAIAAQSAAMVNEFGVRTKFMAVRFGNVLGSSGSVIPIFKRQIANGGPVTVTHPEVTRYFMTIPEAVGLVLQASVLGKGGEIFVLDMGQPVKIAELARQMIELSGFTAGEEIEIVFTGLKPGEKLYEELQHRDELHTPTEHPRIMRFTSPVVEDRDGLKELEQYLHQLEPNELKKLLAEKVGDYTPFFD